MLNLYVPSRLVNFKTENEKLKNIRVISVFKVSPLYF